MYQMEPTTGKACAQGAATHPSESQARSASLTPLPRSFYARPVLEVARDCIGKLLVCRESSVLVGRIVEAEAYRGPEDRAAHSFGGRRTQRTEVMFGPPGHAYVFVLYGRHHNLNLVTGDPGEPEAVLIRAVEPTTGLEIMAKRRNVRADQKVLTNGPGKLCEAFGVTRQHYGRDLTRGTLFLSDAPKTAVGTTTRVGVDYAGSWAEKPWRFFEPGNRYVSHAPKAPSP